jgi:hypothetical protein
MEQKYSVGRNFHISDLTNEVVHVKICSSNYPCKDNSCKKILKIKL